jgi:hypothetical protein
MTESQWYGSKDGDDLLALVHERLTERKWSLLALNQVRRILNLLPDEPYRRFVDTLELKPGGCDEDRWETTFATALDGAIQRAADLQFEIVASCDPAAEPEAFQSTSGRKTNPAVPLFEAACTQANAAILTARTAANSAQLAVRMLLAEVGHMRLENVRELVVSTQMYLAQVGIYSTLALDLKGKGDTIADLGQTRRPGQLLSLANETRDKLQNQAANKMSNRNFDQRNRAEKLALAHSIREQVGNPFQPYCFEAKWRTETVLKLAQVIETTRAFDRMPILADALLDADCENEGILRHCRGTEKLTKEVPHHAVGCWVLDLILERDATVFAGEPLESRKRPQGRSGPGGRGGRMGRFTPPPTEMM